MMSRNKRLKVKQYIDCYLDFDGYVVDLIAHLQRLEKEWPGCYIETSRDDDPSVWYERTENDEEYQKRILRKEKLEEEQKQRELELLSKLKAKYGEV